MLCDEESMIDDSDALEESVNDGESLRSRSRFDVVVLFDGGNESV